MLSNRRLFSFVVLAATMVGNGRLLGQDEAILGTYEYVICTPQCDQTDSDTIETGLIVLDSSLQLSTTDAGLFTEGLPLGQQANGCYVEISGPTPTWNGLLRWRRDSLLTVPMQSTPHSGAYAEVHVTGDTLVGSVYGWHLTVVTSESDTLWDSTSRRGEIRALRVAQPDPSLCVEARRASVPTLTAYRQAPATYMMQGKVPPLMFHVRGTVRDSVGLPMVDAIVLYTPAGTDAGTEAARSDSTGSFAFALHQSGEFMVVAMVSGRIWSVANIMLPADSLRTLDLRVPRCARTRTCPEQPDRDVPLLTLAGCYTLAWHDSTWSNLLPVSVRLEAVRDTTLGAATLNYSLQPMRQEALSSIRWSGLMYAWWNPIRPDSLVLTFRSVDAGWTAGLRMVGDSIWGKVTFSGGPLDPPSAVAISGRRIECSVSEGT